MSTASKVTLCLSIVTAGAIIGGVHYKKKSDQMKLREGIYKDLERQERKRQNRMELEQQIALTKRLTEERDRRENHSH